MEGSEGKLILALKTVNKTGVVQKKTAQNLQPGSAVALWSWEERLWGRRTIIMVAVTSWKPEKTPRVHSALHITCASVKLECFQCCSPSGSRLVTIQGSYLGSTGHAQTFQHCPAACPARGSGRASVPLPGQVTAGIAFPQCTAQSSRTSYSLEFNCTAAGEHENYWHEADLGLLWSRN